MHQQSKTNRSAGRRADYNRHYFTPGDSDRCAVVRTLYDLATVSSFLVQS
jgi:hypothetical protein